CLRLDAPSDAYDSMGAVIGTDVGKEGSYMRDSAAELFGGAKQGIDEIRPTYQQSLNHAKNLLRFSITAIIYLRTGFPEDAFEDFKWNGG
ncbi:hypothetical protein HDU99_000948, partial [Rhizoclosmatium hyalinum]